MDRNRREAAGLDLHHGVDCPEGRTRQGEDFYDAISTTPVLDLDLQRHKNDQNREIIREI